MNGLKFIGQPDHFIAGVPQGDLLIVESLAHAHEISTEQAGELVKTGLYDHAEFADPVEPKAAEDVAEAPQESHN